MSTPGLVLASAGLIATILGVTIAVIIAIPLWKIPRRATRAAKDVARQEVTAMKNEVHMLQRAYAEYLLAVQNSVDGPSFDRQVANIRRAYGNPDLWNVAVYSAQKRLWPLVQSANLLQVWDRQDATFRSVVHDALVALAEAQRDSNNNDPGTVALWTAIAYALLGESSASLGALERLDEHSDIQFLRPYVDLFWDMFQFAPIDELQTLAQLWGLSALENAADLAQAVTQYWHEPVLSPGLHGFILGWSRETGRYARIEVRELREDDATPIWIIQINTYQKSSGALKGTPVLKQERVSQPNLNETMSMLTSQFVGLVVAPYELQVRWQEDELMVARQAAEWADLTKVFQGD